MDSLGITRSLYKEIAARKASLALVDPLAFSSTVLRCANRQLILAEAPPAGDYAFSILKIEVAGDPVPLRLLVNRIVGTVVDLYTAIDKDAMPPIGSDVTLYGGPLAESELFYFDPPSVTEYGTDSAKNIVTVNYSGQTIGPSGVSNRVGDNGSYNQKRQHSIVITCESAFNLQVGFESDAIAAFDNRVYHVMLCEQLVAVAHGFRMDGANGRYGIGDITTVPAIVERSGPDAVSQAWLINFVVEIRK